MPARCRGGEDKTFACAGHRDIQDAHFLGKRDGLFGFGDDLMADGSKTAFGVRVDDLKAERVGSVDEALAVLIAHVEFRIEFGTKDDGKFKALALVDAHNADGVFGGAVGFGGRPVLSLLEQLFNEFHKPRQRNGLGGGYKALELYRSLMEFQ